MGGEMRKVRGDARTGEGRLPVHKDEDLVEPLEGPDKDRLYTSQLSLHPLCSPYSSSQAAPILLHPPLFPLRSRPPLHHILMLLSSVSRGSPKRTWIRHDLQQTPPLPILIHTIQLLPRARKETAADGVDDGVCRRPYHISRARHRVTSIVPAPRYR